MKYIIFVIIWPLVFFSGNTLIGQNQKNIDSLKTVLSTNSSDTDSIDASIELFRMYQRTDTVTALDYLNSAIAKSLEINDINRLVQGYLVYSNYYWKKSNLVRSKEFLSLAESELSKIDDDEIKAKYYLEKGIVSHREAKYSIAIEKFLDAKNLYEKLQDTLAISKCHTNIGGSYWEMNQPDEALKNYLTAFEVLESMEESNEVSASGILGNMGLIYRQKNRYKEALVYYKKSLALNRKNNMKMSEAINLQNIGSLYTKSEQFQKALPYFEEAKKVATEIDDKIGILYANHSIGNTYRHFGQFEKAIGILESNLKLAEKLNNREELKNLNRDIAESYERGGFYAKALEYRKTYEIWKDSLINENHLKKIKELELGFETAKKDKEITILTKENELKEAQVAKESTLRNALISGLIALGIIGVLVFYVMRQRLKNQKIVAAKNEQITKAQLSEELQTLEMKALRSQMNPHFLFNCLNSINTMILNDENENASRYLAKFSKLVRLLLENSEQPMVSLKDEMEMLETYIQLESLRFNTKLEYHINIDDSIEQDSTLLPSMVIQPFVENAIWHGLLHKEKENKGLLTIEVKEKDNKLYCSIIDNGVGREKSVALKKEGGLKKKSMGIKITADRLKILTQQKIQDVIHIIDLKDDQKNALGTQVDIQIPLV